MFRLVGLSRVLREAVPPELVPAFWVITAIGSPEILLVGLSLAYWNAERHRDGMLRLMGVTVFALTVALTLKYWLALPRPPASVQRYPIEPSPVGFPSGHAIAGAVAFGGAVVVMDRLRDVWWTSTAVVGAGLVGVSRVVIGVHYLGDVLAGFAIGLVVLGVVAATGVQTRWVFVAAAVLAVPALYVTDVDTDAILALAGSLGALSAIELRADTPVPKFASLSQRAAFNGVGLVAIVIGLGAESLLDHVAVLAFGVDFLLVGTIVALPAGVGQFDLPTPADS